MRDSQRGQPFVIDAKTVSMAGASRVLAVDPSIFGSTMTLPRSAPVNAVQAADRVDATPEPEDGSQVAIMQIDGPLLQRGQAHICGFADGYDFIAERFASAMDDPKVGALVMRVDSPGGDVAGVDEGVRRMREAKARSGGKRVIVYADELIASAAYWIAAGVADEIMIPPMGAVGSIGTIGYWVDITKALEDVGYSVHVVRDPAGKAAAHPAGPVAEVADEQLSKLVTESTNRFVAHVSKARGMSAATIRGLNGQVLRGQEAVDVGLADKVGSFEKAIESAARGARERRKTMKGQKALAALGLDENATEEQIARAAEQRIVGLEIEKATGKTGAAAVETHIALATAAKSHAEKLAALEDRERADLVARLVESGWEIPATAWEKGSDGLPVAGKPASQWASMPIEALRARVETLSAQPKATVPKPPASTGAHDLTPHQKAVAKELGLDEAEYARNLAAYKKGR